jgi:hypothetical protein
VTTFVLVHGAMHGGWCWRDVAGELRARDHLVFTPTLTGQGERAHLRTSGTGIATHDESLLDVEPPETAARYRSLAAASPGGDVVPATDAFLDQWGVTDPAARAWVAPRLTDFPLRCATDVVEYDAARLAAVLQAYVCHTAPPLASLAASYARACASGWATADLACGHDAMVEAPADTAALLERLAAGQR